MSTFPNELLTYTIIATLMVWVLPDFMLILIISYLTYNFDKNNTISKFVVYVVKAQLSPESQNRDKMSDWVKKRYATLQKLMEDDMIK
jgi:hypothetical protein